MRTTLLLSVPLLLGAQACSLPSVSAGAGYARLAVDGRLGYVNGATTASIDQDVQSAFGLGDDQGSPYGRAMVDFGVPVLAVSGFAFAEEGDGVLQANFGDSPILTAGTPVHSKLDMWNAKGSLAFDIGLGPVTISPGLAVDYFDLDLTVNDLIGIANENVQLQGPVPLGFLRGQVDLGIVSATAEVGYVQADVQDVNGKFLDVEATVALHPNSWLDLFVGYRSLGLNLDGTIDGDTFNADITISGFFAGGGITF